MGTTADDFDLTDRAVQQDPHHHYEDLRLGGVQYIPTNDTFLILRHEDATAVLRDPSTFSSQLGSGRGAAPEEVQDEIARITAEGLPKPRTLLDNDPPSHGRYRRCVSRAFTPKKMEKLRPFVEQLADELIAAWPDPSSVEFVEDFAVPLPVRTIAHALNIPEDREDDFKSWSDANTATIGATISAEEHVRNAQLTLDMQRFFIDQFEQRRTSPQDDILTTLLGSHIGAEPDGSDAEPLNMAELVRIVQQLLVAGNETTTKLLAETMRLVAESPGEWERLRKNPDRIPAVVEESLRISSPNQGLQRLAMTDTEIGGVAIPKGSKLVVMFAAANRDPEMFGCPHDLDPDRDNLRDHIAFGLGTHFCVGANLARLEANVGMERLVKRVESYRLHDDNTFEYLPSYVLRGLKRLHIDAALDKATR